MKTAVINYNSGNVQSVLFALERLGVQANLTGDHDEIRSADKVIFPGVGEAGTTMQHLKKYGLDKLIKNLKQPVLGICLGMQLLCEHSEEGDTTCMNIIPQKVKKFQPSDPVHKVPHMGWNKIQELKGEPLPQNLEGSYCYFVHSFYVEKGPFTAAVTDYILPFSAAVQKDNFYATQFHPEKSGEIGEQILKRFLEL
ncbi:MAG: imidazole glycerol phosphate synthase subunit HisH [Bacteroidetes bacterium]|nr:imidazole glycerol phosphate synthase subunit HisH [Bacteroidota bacterium]